MGEFIVTCNSTMQEYLVTVTGSSSMFLVLEKKSEDAINKVYEK